MACCPAHDDANPSLSISQGNDGAILVHCFAGCEAESVCAALGLKTSDLFDSDCSAQNPTTRTVYSYTDEESHELYRKIRIEPGIDGKTKSFYSEHIDENGQIIRNLQGCRRVLYRLPEILKGIAENKTIYLVEGEKDADNLVANGLIATTSLEAVKWPEDFTEVLKKADVALLYDLDDTGLKRKELISKSLFGKVTRLRVIDLPGLEYQPSHGLDVSDWLAQGHAIKDLVEITAKTPDYSPSARPEKILAVTMDEFLQLELPKREMILAPFLPSQVYVLISALEGEG